jgi:hypothetical protein
MSNYQKLSSLIQEKADLSSFFKKEYTLNEYKGIIFEALKMRDFPVIEAISEHLPLENWFDKKFYLNRFRNTSNKNIDQFIFCMAISKIRACFSPEEKGEFLYAGLITRNDKMSYYASSDNDWNIVFSDNSSEEDVIGIQFEPVAEYDIKTLDGKHPKKEYYESYFNRIFSKFTDKGKHFYLLASFSITIAQLREVSGFIVFNDSDLIESSQDKQAIQELNNDLKKSINYLKEQLDFDYWPSELRSEFVEISSRRMGFAKISALADCKHFLEKLLPIIEYKKLDNDLNTKDDSIKKRKIKI